MKILALDLGDVWVGSALSDVLGITCKPYKTIKLPELEEFLAQTVQEFSIATVVVGLPTTLSGTQSAQTKKILAQTTELEQKFPNVEFKLCDERLSSKRAQAVGCANKKSHDFKKQEHSIAAAFILQTYLDRIAFDRM